MLAGLGADVIKVERRAGRRRATRRPSPPASPRGWPALRFHAFNRGKRSVVLDLDDAADRADFLRLVATADFVVEETAGPGVMDGRGLGFEALRAVRPDLVYVAISPFGQTGPYAHHLATDLTLAANGGSMALTAIPTADRCASRCPRPGTTPRSRVPWGPWWPTTAVWPPARPSSWTHRCRPPCSGPVCRPMIAHAIQGKDIERFGTVLQLSTLVTPLRVPVRRRRGLPHRHRRHPHGDHAVDGGQRRGHAGVADTEDWSTYEARMLTADEITLTYDEVRAAVTAFTLKHRKMELFEGGIARRVTIAPVNTAADVIALEQLRVRDYWEELTLPSERTLPATGSFVKATGTPVAWTPAGARGGRHTDEVRAEPAVQVRESHPGGAGRAGPACRSRA